MIVAPYMPPNAIREVFEWSTDVMTTLNGKEQRISRREYPRRIYTNTYIAESEDEIQSWKYEFAQGLDNIQLVPLWQETMWTTVEETAGSSAILVDTSELEDHFGPYFFIMSPDEQTWETITSNSRTSTTITISVGTLDNTYPPGSRVVPMEYCWYENNIGYRPYAVNAAALDVTLTQRSYPEMGGVASYRVYNGRPVLLQQPIASGMQETFWQNLERIDLGNVIEVISSQSTAAVMSARRYLISSKTDRRWWIKFLDLCRGQQNHFYAPTYRDDLTVLTQPTQGGSSFTVRDTDEAGAVWYESVSSHKQLAIWTADGDVQLKEIHPDTVSNGDGTITLEVTTPFTNTADGSTIQKVSFLEKVRLGSDRVEFEHTHEGAVVSLLLRTIQE